MAERARCLGRLRVTHRDSDDFYLTAAEREEEREENLLTASRMFAALSRTPEGGVGEVLERPTRRRGQRFAAGLGRGAVVLRAGLPESAGNLAGHPPG
jgi:hypothetical protein